MTDEEAGMYAYGVYCESVGSLHYQGAPLPRWGELPLPIRAGWTAAAARMAQIEREEQASRRAPDESPEGVILNALRMWTPNAYLREARLALALLVQQRDEGATHGQVLDTLLHRDAAP